jgi:peptidoglycan/LPS O-acetylase OafA/YrhL
VAVCARRSICALYILSLVSNILISNETYSEQLSAGTAPANPRVTENASARRMVFLDALRGLAALSVFISHTAERLSPTLRQIIYTRFDLGHFGVTLFFMCSGFIIPFSLERQNSLVSFWISRTFRLYPLYWFTIAVSVLVTFIQSGGRSFSAYLVEKDHLQLNS